MNFFVNNDQIEDNFIVIRNSDVNHIKNVLRKSKGDLINIVCDGVNYESEIVDLTSEYIKCEIINSHMAKHEYVKLTIFQGLAKADKIEYIIQKCTELGVYEIVPVEMRRCVVKLDDKDKAKKIDRWNKIAEVAAKQSLRNEILKVNKIASFNDLCEVINNYDIVILAYEKEKKVTLKNVLRNDCNECKNIAVVIGPEGGIADEEYDRLKELGVRPITLGSRILRTETAPVAVASMIMYELEL